jgi:hypothetical protein
VSAINRKVIEPRVRQEDGVQLSKDVLLIIPHPGYVDATIAQGSKDLEASRRHVDIVDLASRTPIVNGQAHAVATIRYDNLTTANGVIIRVCTDVTRVGVKQVMRNSANVLLVVVRDSACSKTRRVPCSLSTLCSVHVTR